MFDKMRKGAFLLMLAGLAVVTLTGSPAGAASSKPAVSAAVDRAAAPAGPWLDGGDAPLVILYNQLDNPGANAVSSQNFETAYDAYDSFGADDFFVPPNTSWTIKGVGINGLYYGCVPPACGPASSFNLFFHVDNGGLPKDPPAATRANLTYVEDPPGTFKIKVIPSITIPGGPAGRHVWVSAQANLDFGVGGQFGWGVRTVQSNDAAAWQNPGGGFLVCPDWEPMAGCIGIVDPDLQFLLAGVAAGGGFYYQDDVNFDNGDDAFTAGCHWEFNDALCTNLRGFSSGDRCENPMDLIEWTNKDCHPFAPVDLVRHYCDFECMNMGHLNGHCEVVANHCGAGQHSARCVCTD